MSSPTAKEIPPDREKAGVRTGRAPISDIPGTLTPRGVRQPSILLVDADERTLEIECRMLRSLGYRRIVAATSTEEALLHLKQEPGGADILICDLNMPGTDGIKFLQTLRTTPFRGSVILSGAGRRIMNTVRQLLGESRLVVLGTITKPASREALRAVLADWGPQTDAASLTPAQVFSATELHRANREQQWILHYQPQVDLRTGAFVALEALVRWNHPELGLILPEPFIDLAEECGAIEALTVSVAKQALRQRALWEAAGLPLRVAVNISMVCLNSPDFERRFASIVREAGVEPQSVTLEITESRLRSSTPARLENLARLGLHGFGLAIDDFGTGHSSLAQLRGLPITELKVDHGFVHGASEDPNLRPILAGSLRMAQELGLRSVAEGVETESDWQLLQELQCDFAQGYWIGRPMAVERVPEWLASWQARWPNLLRGS